MIDDFYKPAWTEGHEKFAADVSAEFGRLACWLRRGAKTKTMAAPTQPRVSV